MNITSRASVATVAAVGGNRRLRSGAPCQLSSEEQIHSSAQVRSQDGAVGQHGSGAAADRSRPDEQGPARWRDRGWIFLSASALPTGYSVGLLYIIVCSPGFIAGQSSTADDTSTVGFGTQTAIVQGGCQPLLCRCSQQETALTLWLQDPYFRHTQKNVAMARRYNVRSLASQCLGIIPDAGPAGLRCPARVWWSAPKTIRNRGVAAGFSRARRF